MDGLSFGSGLEQRYYLYLIKKKANGEIKDFKTQVRFKILKGYYHKGVKVRDIHYVADFVVERLDGTVIVIDTKSPVTRGLQHFKDKVKLLLNENPQFDFWVVVEPRKHVFNTEPLHGSGREWE